MIPVGVTLGETWWDGATGNETRIERRQRIDQDVEDKVSVAVSAEDRCSDLDDRYREAAVLKKVEPILRPSWTPRVE